MRKRKGWGQIRETKNKMIDKGEKGRSRIKIENNNKKEVYLNGNSL